MRVPRGIGVLIAITVGSVGLGRSKAHAKRDEALLRISLAIPQLCNGQDGKPVLPRFLPVRYGTEQFPVVIENVSDKPIQVWAEGNSIGDETLTFEVKGPDGQPHIVRPVFRDYSKNIFRTVRLLPGEKYVRNVSYNAAPPLWEGFPSPAPGTHYNRCSDLLGWLLPAISTGLVTDVLLCELYEQA